LLWIAVAFAGAAAILVMLGVAGWVFVIGRIEQQVAQIPANPAPTTTSHRPTAPAPSPPSPSAGDTKNSDDGRPGDKDQLADGVDPAPGEGKVPDELQGQWELMTTVDVERKEPPLSSQEGDGLLIKGNRAEWNNMTSLRAGKGRVSVNLATTPPRLDLKTENRVYKCIYHLSQEKTYLRLLLDPEGGDYPAGLDERRGPKGNGYLEIYLQRPPPRSRPLAKDTPGAKKPKIAWPQTENPVVS
jgi:hypothetical protein